MAYGSLAALALAHTKDDKAQQTSKQSSTTTHSNSQKK
jgi:hypothetical protein